ncbi:MULTISPECIES: Imm3 family immunity protein [Lysinibacillus]|uniref:Imm3 family immunity protein n=1 Tax=Lysinibacillus irui TaxID=2998077 RepID=A0AAJ5RLZ6_9BACI|nr:MULTISPECIES: Imm3 family immunity protein [Lysinibacillus]WDV05480.1 Imm3 family immunity protein [Lysinibacillus irui]
MEFTYQEYNEYINETYKEFKEEKMSNKEAIARTYNEYDMVAKKSETDKGIVYIELAEILITHLKAMYTFKSYIENVLIELDFNLIKLEKALSQEEYNDLFSRRVHVLQELEKMPLDYYQTVCWYYEELIEEVQKYISNFIEENKNTDTIVTDVLQRFERDCKNTKSEKYIIYTTLAENLCNQGLKSVNGIEDIKNELQIFQVYDISNEQLTEDEQEKLANRIKNVLTRLK